jgi:coenzyme F420-0:L-glutamate ligase/coenzyme F420-1:gamma-L-glutamate ligase
VTGYSVHPVTGIREVRPGDDLAALLVAATDLRDGDVLVVTSKVVSKAEGRVVRGTKDDAVASETARVVARRGSTTIARHHLGLVMAAAGVDASNTEPGTFVLLPRDPDGSARRLRESLREATGANVAVVVSDTFGRAWRAGQTDVAVGAAGLEVLDDHAGRTDGYGNPLLVTAPAVADQVAGAAELAQGKTTGVPAAVLRGLGDRVLPPGEHGPGAAALVREEAGDMFGLGSREAVLAALQDHATGFGAASPAEALLDAASALGLVGVVGDDDGTVEVPLPDDPRAAGRAEARLEALARAHGWVRVKGTDTSTDTSTDTGTDTGTDAGADTAVFRGTTP